MDPAKVFTVKEWALPDSIKVVDLLGDCKIYRRFIQGYSQVVSSLTALTKKGIKFQWTPKAEEAFQSLKSAFKSASVFMHFIPTRLSLSKLMLQTTSHPESCLKSTTREIAHNSVLLKETFPSGM